MSNISISNAIKDYFKCPITLQKFEDPVIAQDGFTYESTAIAYHLTQNDIPQSPLTRQRMTTELYPNNVMRQQLGLPIRNYAVPSVPSVPFNERFDTTAQLGDVRIRVDMDRVFRSYYIRYVIVLCGAIFGFIAATILVLMIMSIIRLATFPFYFITKSIVVFGAKYVSYIL